jgi:hypothetical protein
MNKNDTAFDYDKPCMICKVIGERQTISLPTKERGIDMWKLCFSCTNKVVETAAIMDYSVVMRSIMLVNHNSKLNG